MELPPHAAIHHLTTDLNATFILSIGAFLLSMVLTPVYTYFAYRYKLSLIHISEPTRPY